MNFGDESGANIRSKSTMDAIDAMSSHLCGNVLVLLCNPEIICPENKQISTAGNNMKMIGSLMVGRFRAR